MEKSKSDYKQKKRIVKDKDALMGVKVEKAMSGKMMTKPTKKMSGGMAIGGGHKNYKMSGKIKS